MLGTFSEHLFETYTGTTLPRQRIQEQQQTALSPPPRSHVPFLFVGWFVSRIT